MATFEQRVAALEEVVCALLGAGSAPGRSPGASDVMVLFASPAMVTRTVERCRAARGAATARPSPRGTAPRSTGRSRGESVRPGMRPRLAIGTPSISLMSPVKSIGVAPLMYEPTANESTGAPASLK